MNFLSFAYKLLWKLEYQPEVLAALYTQFFSCQYVQGTLLMALHCPPKTGQHYLPCISVACRPLHLHWKLKLGYWGTQDPCPIFLIQIGLMLLLWQFPSHCRSRMRFPVLHSLCLHQPMIDARWSWYLLHPQTLPNACHGYRAAVCLRMSAWKLHQLRIRFYLFHLLAEWHWASYLTSPGHCLLVWEPGIQTEASSLWNVSEVMLTKNLGQLPGGDRTPLCCTAQVMRCKSRS